MTQISIFSCLSNIQILLHTLINGKLVGTDRTGNRYYKGKPRRGGLGRERRWVIYSKAPEASLVEPEWHGWLHHQTDTVPASDSRYRQSWQRPYQPNQTGTGRAYLPPGHTLKGGNRDNATGDYTAWRPPQ